MHIDMWFDVTSPRCYLALRHLRGALTSFDESHEVEVNLHAFFIDPELDHSLEIPRRVHLIENCGFSLEEALEEDRVFEELGRSEGVVFDFERLIVAPSSAAHRAIAAAADYDLECDATTGPDTYALKLAEAICRAHFEGGLDISDPDVLIGCAQDIGVDPRRIVEALAGADYAARVFSDFQIGVQMGIDEVPTSLIDAHFLVSDHGSINALGTILATAWQASRKDVH